MTLAEIKAAAAATRHPLSGASMPERRLVRHVDWLILRVEELAEALGDLANRAENLVEAAPEAGSTWGYLVSDVFGSVRDARAALARLEEK